MNTAYYTITGAPIQLDEVERKVIRPEAGAVVVFAGIVREFTKGKRTIYLEYQAYPSMAVKQMAKIGEEIAGRWPGTQTAITHRIGRLAISETAVAVAVSSPHRAFAFAASEYAMDRIKQIVPIWKKEYWEDGSAWIGNQLESSGGIPREGRDR